MIQKETLEQTTSGTWAASGTVTIQLDRIGLATRYDTYFEITPSATLLGANQPDALWRPFRQLDFVSGGEVYFTMPSTAEGHGGTLLHYLNVVDKLGRGFVHQIIVAPSQVFYAPKLTFHAGVRPQRRDGVDNPYDLSGFMPVGLGGSPQITWSTSANSVMDDIVTLSSGTLYVTASRVIGNDDEVRAEMAGQQVDVLLAMTGTPNITGLVPAWVGNVESPVAVAANYGSELDAQTSGWLKRVTLLAQDAAATRPARADDQVTALAFYDANLSRTIFKSRSERLADYLPDGDFLVADDAAGLGGVGVAPGGIYVSDMRSHARNPLEQILGWDARHNKTGFAKWQRTIATNSSGDDMLTLTERVKEYFGSLNTKS